MDNTAAPIFVSLCNMVRIVVYSTTKYRHGLSIGGIIVDGGTLIGRQEIVPNVEFPDPSYHGAVWSKLKP